MWGPKLDSTTSSQQQQQQQQQDKKHLIEEDSGQIDSGFLSSEQILQSFNSDSEEDHSPAAPAPSTGPLSSEGVLPQKQQQQVDTYLDSGLVEDVEESQETTAHAEDQQMLLERELDNGLAEWLCTLDLKNPSPSINNLSRKVDCTTTSMDQMNISDAPKQQTTTQQRTFEMPEEEQPWEMCYKQDAEGDTYLHMAVSEGAEDIVRDLIRITPHPCLLDIQNDLLQSPLHLAVLTGNVRLVRMLLLAGAESSIRDKYGNTPLHLACAAGDLDCVRALTERITASEEVTAVSCTGVLVPEKESKQQQQQSPNGKAKRMHLVQYADVELRNYDGERCVHIAASVTGTEKNKHVDVMRQLVVRSGADVNAREGKAGFTALHMAVERGDKDLVRFLLDECANVNLEVASYGRWTAYQIATVNRNQELMSMLRSKGAEALDVSSSEESDEDDAEESEIFGLYGASAATNGGVSSFFNDQIMPLVGY